MPQPSPGNTALLINIESGYGRTSSSWVLDQILKSVEAEVGTTMGPLYVSIYDVHGRSVHPARRDWRWWMSITTIALQLLVSVIPYCKDSDYSVLLLSLFGTGLAFIHGSLPQWKREKWAGRLDRKRGTYCLSRGNGTPHAIILRNASGDCPHFEDLATLRVRCTRACKIAIDGLSVLWVIVLLMALGLKQHAWYLLAIGCIGMIQNLLVAAVPQTLACNGLQMELVHSRISETKIMTTLMKTETLFPKIGAALVPKFFPGELREDEKMFRALAAKNHASR